MPFVARRLAFLTSCHDFVVIGNEFGRSVAVFCRGLCRHFFNQLSLLTASFF